MKPPERWRKSKLMFVYLLYSLLLPLIVLNLLAIISGFFFIGARKIKKLRRCKAEV
jgi:uncharacterized integral membrane protein